MDWVIAAEQIRWSMKISLSVFVFWFFFYDPSTSSTRSWLISYFFFSLNQNLTWDNSSWFDNFIKRLKNMKLKSAPWTAELLDRSIDGLFWSNVILE